MTTKVMKGFMKVLCVILCLIISTTVYTGSISTTAYAGSILWAAKHSSTSLEKDQEWLLSATTEDGEDIDDLVFINNTDGNVTIRYEVINKSGVFDLAKGATKEIDANCQVSGTYQVRFEVKDSNGNLKDVTWTMEYKKKDITITLTEDSGWSF